MLPWADGPQHVNSIYTAFLDFLAYSVFNFFFFSLFADSTGLGRYLAISCSAFLIDSVEFPHAHRDQHIAQLEGLEFSLPLRRISKALKWVSHPRLLSNYVYVVSLDHFHCPDVIKKSSLSMQFSALWAENEIKKLLFLFAKAIVTTWWLQYESDTPFVMTPKTIWNGVH